MCGHKWIVVNNISACVKCGLTIDRATGKPLGFDKRLVERFNRRGNKK